RSRTSGRTKPRPVTPDAPLVPRAPASSLRTARPSPRRCGAADRADRSADPSLSWSWLPMILASPDVPAPPVRRHDLDWIRVGAFLLLILYHVGMFYVPWDWHVKSGYELVWLEPVMQLTNPWRLTLL